MFIQKNVIKQTGLTLLESMLILVIVGVGLAFSLRQYASFRDYKNAQQAILNAEILFTGAQAYYFANCRGKYNPNATTSSSAEYGGTLNPANTSLTTKTLNIASDLVTPGFVGKWPLQGSALIDANSSNAYVVQFNARTAMTGKTAYACWNFSGTKTCSTSPAQTLSTPIISWNLQVAIKLANNKESQADMYKGLTNATCVSSYSGGRVLSCDTNPSGGSDNTYLVWQRQPSFASPVTNSDLWGSMPRLKQFVSQYTNDPNYELNNSSYATSTGINYLCGG